MSSEIKSSATTAAGYVYQTMQGVNLLCDWLEAPTRYKRIRFECDAETIAPKGLDDLVAVRADDKVDLWQVKFSPSPDKYLLEWKWLLEKKGKAGGTARTNIRKWFDALDAIPPSKVGSIRLLTNRIPDLNIEKCLRGGKFIDYKLAPMDIQARVEQDLGSEVNALRFFKMLEIMHSDKGFSSIESHVTQRLRRHSTPEGIETLKNRAINWSIQKSQPAPDGWITFEVLKSTLRITVPEPLPEDFTIPLGYRVPDNEFHAKFMSSLKARPLQPLVLTGPPGRGKSTYLSKVCELLESEKIPFVRHHYYLSAADRTYDRHTSFAVQESILAQVKEFHGDVVTPHHELTSSLLACSAHYKTLGKPFVVIIDGLDHVWRNQGRDKRALDEIFNQLLPICENLVLVVGTQPVEDSQLPNRLIVEAPRNSWLELPSMSANAVLQYLRKEVQQGRLHLNANRSIIETELQEAAAKLRERTAGHPLHVIYATEELIRTGRELSSWNVERLSGDLGHDAKTYYESLWQLLNASQKDVLRLVCEFRFFWPSRAFAEISTLSLSPLPDVTAVEHLLHASPAGLRPFHESLIVFIKQTDGFEQRINELENFVEIWLDGDAPTALKVNWLWLIKARRGNSDELIRGLQRNWVLERLQEGYAPSLIENLLDSAEEYAVQTTRYAEAYRLRHLKYRLLNSLSYRLMGEDAARLKACTWTLAADDNVIDEAYASRHESSIVDVVALGLALNARGNIVAATECAQEALRRHRGESRFTKTNQSSDALSKALYLAQAFAKLGVLDSTPKNEAKWIAERWPQIANKFLAARVDNEKLRSLIDVLPHLPDTESKLMVCDATFRAAALAEANLSAWAEFNIILSGNLAGCIHALAGSEASISLRPLNFDWREGSYEETRAALTTLAHDWFFGAVRVKLIAKKNVSLLDSPKFNNREITSDYFNHLSNLAKKFAIIWAAGRPIKFSQLYEELPPLNIAGYDLNHDLGQGTSEFKSALHCIAVDIQLMSAQFGIATLVEKDDLLRAMVQTWFDADQFRTQYVTSLTKILSDDAAEEFIRQQLTLLNTQVKEETGVRLMAMLELCEMALRHDLKCLATDLCSKTWELALGYAQRKDPAMSDVMDAIEYLIPSSPKDALRLLMEVAPQIHNILDFTDGKGTRHISARADELLAKLDRQALVEKYRSHTDCSDWSQAEDSLKAFISTATSECEFTGAVLRTGIHLDAIKSLQIAASNGDANSTKLLSEIEQHRSGHFGGIFETTSTSSGPDSRPFLSDVKMYQINELERLQDDLKEHYGVRAEVLCEWYCYWETQGHGSQLIGILEPTLLSDACRDNDLSELLDLAFATKLRLEGARKAFPYIVQAQLFRGGWLGNMERSEKTVSRLKQVVGRYKSRCDEFFLKSTYSWLDRPKKNRIIPSEMMVLFLSLQGRTAEAIQFVEAMVQSIKEDTRTLNLKAPTWSNKLLGRNTELELLMARLRWPVASTRWWTMQELASLLLSESVQEEVFERLLNELRGCQLESETVEIVSIFWMAFNRGYPITNDLTTSIRHPSMLVEHLLADMGIKFKAIITPPLELAPVDFKVPSNFKQVQGRDVPRIYMSLIKHLEQQMNRPLAQQFAFEWSLTEAAYPDAPLQGDLAYFIRPVGDNATAGFASRTLLRMLAAFQRTIEVARKSWGLPDKVALDFLQHVLPFEPSLAFLSPSYPSWMPQLDSPTTANETSITEFIIKIQNNLKATKPTTALLSLITPIKVSPYEIIELSLVRCRKWGNLPIDAESLANRIDYDQQHRGHIALDSDTWGISQMQCMGLDDVLDEETQSAPMAAFPTFSRVGYLQKELYPKRLRLPLITGLNEKITISPSGDKLTMSANGKLIATCLYWNAGWSPGHPISISGLNGTALLGEMVEPSGEKEAPPDSHFYLWTVTRLSRKYGYGTFEESVPIYGIFTQQIKKA
ncbi:ATP-binding protein [Undibacterium macrobrachii]|uniref:NACHT domain-containing protein n=1 Tax=Undibacterium macrobrachii TaxID=1119058 RepID=A0ABQ2XLQ2_9BURK|nr:NACHT domain-containing protein [Undibacterium macrobrachii]GGX23281.1 hypothetical protein GCM10011282_31720 [Undibacterium macrobrachii]